MVKAPIYKDTYYTTSSNSLVYTISADGGVIFSGKAYKMPGQANIKININKICQDYLRQDIDSLITGSTSQTNSDACKDFVLKNSTGGTIETYRFLYDWDYDHSWTGQSATLSQPINGEYAANMWKPKTSVASTGTNAVTTNTTGGTYNKLSCGDYALIYVNARGGWDAFLFTGKCRRTDTMNQYNYNRAFDNNTAEFETGRYISEIEENYELNTGILTEAQAALFAKHLIGSNKVYLHNLNDNTIKPAVITDKQAAYKLNGDGDILTYTLKIKLSQSKIRQ